MGAACDQRPTSRYIQLGHYATARRSLEQSTSRARQAIRHDVETERYRTDAAFYCQLAFHKEFNLIDFTLAINDHSRTAYLEIGNNWDDIRHRLQCERVRVWINARTGGLLEVSGWDKPGLTFCHDPLDHCSKDSRRRCLTSYLRNYSRTSVNVIHRTARTYLLESLAGQELLTLSNKSPADMAHLCVEISFIRETVLVALQSTVPVGVEILARDNVFSSLCLRCDRKVVTNTKRAIIEDFMDALQRQGLLWTEMHPIEAVVYRDFDVDLSLTAIPVKENGRLDYYRLYAYTKRWEFFHDGVASKRESSEEDMGWVMPLIAPLSIMDLLVKEKWAEEADRILQLDRRPDPNHMAVTEYREQVSLFHEVIWSLSGSLSRYGEFNRSLSESNLVEWLYCASVATINRTIIPTMRALNSLFFMSRGREKNGIKWQVRYTLLASQNLQAHQLALGSKWDMEWNAHIQKTPNRPSSNHSILVQWRDLGKKLEIYALRDNESVRLLQEVQNLEQLGAPLFNYCHQYGAIEMGVRHRNSTDERSVRQVFRQFTHTKLPSLYAALLHIGKSEGSVLAFAAEEETRLALQLDGFQLRAWKAWFWGESENLLEQS